MDRQRFFSIFVSTLVISFFIDNCAPRPIQIEPSKNPTTTPTIISPTVTPTLVLPLETSLPKVTCNDENRILKIDFNYKDDPTQHRWGEPFDGRPSFLIFPDELFLDDVMQITSTSRYGMDYQVNTFVNSIEFAAKLGENARVYAYLKLQTLDGTATKNVYFSFQPGTAAPLKESDEEWTVFVDAQLVKNDWRLFQISLPDIVGSTEGDQWRVDQLVHLRVRGNLTIAFICLYA